MSCNLSIEEELNADAQAQEQQPANISPTQHPLTQATPPSPSSHPDPTYLLTAAASVAATMQHQCSELRM